MTARVSVIIPTCRRPHLLIRCLEALTDQDLAADQYEVVVADDAAHERTRRLVESFSRQQGSQPCIRYLAVRGRHGPAAARNAGWRVANADIIAFTDDDCIPEESWLRQGLMAFERGLDATWGSIVMPLPKDPTDYELDASRLQGSEFATANCFCRRRLLTEVGGLDEQFTAPWREDSDLYFSLLEHGAKIERTPEAVVVHPIRPAPWGVSIRQQRKILFDALLYKKHPQLYRARIRQRPPWHYYRILLALAAAAIGWSSGHPLIAGLCTIAWLSLTGEFCLSRLRITSRRFGHVLEMMLTSAVIPPLAIFWRLVGAVRFRVMFF